jgi:hypothetical protein
MKNFRSLVTLCVISLVMVTACKEDFRSDSSVSPDQLQSKKSARLSAETKAKLEKLRALLPANFAKTNKLADHNEYRNIVLRAINAVEPTPCGPTSIHAYLDAELADWDSDAFFYADYFYLFYLPGDLAYVFENSSENQYFGVNGEYTQKLTKTFKDLKRFWNIQASDMVMVAMHGKMMYNRARMVQLFQLYGNNLATSEWAADIVKELLDEIPQYRNGNHPIFTFNAYAASADNFIPPYGPLPDKIVMGDGIMDAYASLGYGDVAPQAILAHEYGHHIQFDLNLFGPNTAEATRRTELMADAYSAYFLSHARGAAMQWKRVKQFLQVFFTIGDCAFNNPNHHGTPLQRMAAAEWGYSLANNTQKQGKILTAEEFAVLFDAKLPSIVGAPAP